MGRPVVHFDIGCKDSAKTQEYYKKHFDWKVDALGACCNDRRGSRRHHRPHHRAGA